MKVNIRETKTQEDIPAKISKAIKKDMPLKKHKWLFNWQELFLEKHAEFYKLTLIDDESAVQGIIMLKVENGKMLFMKNLEISPLNYGSKGKYEKIAGCLIAFACKKSFNLAKGNYNGFLLFESKTDLIQLYINKYRAKRISGKNLYIDQLASKKLIEEYLNINMV